MQSISQQLTKRDLRRTLRSARKQLKAEDREQRAKRIAEILVNLPVFETSQYIGIYWPYDSEVDTLPIIETIWSQGKKSYLSCIDPSQERNLIFKEYNRHDQLTINQFNIPEPGTNSPTIRAPHELHLVIVPVVAFDTYGHRVGMGGGFYDNTFSFITNSDMRPKPTLIGLAYSFQQVTQMPVNSWDIVLSGIVTEHRYIPSLV